MANHYYSTLDLEVFQEKNTAFYGSVKIPLTKLRPEELPEEQRRKHRQEDPKNIEILVKAFKKGCWRYDPDNHIKVLLPRSFLDHQLLDHSRHDKPYPFFDPSEPLQYLKGHHRVEAARQFYTDYDEDEKWWIADLYSEGMTDRQIGKIMMC